MSDSDGMEEFESGITEEIRKLVSQPLSDDVSLLAGIAHCQLTNDVGALKTLCDEILFGDWFGDNDPSGLIKRWRWLRYRKRRMRDYEMLRALKLVLTATRACAAMAQENNAGAREIGIFMMILEAKQKERRS